MKPLSRHKKSTWLQIFFGILIFLSIALSAFKPLPAGPGSIGISSTILFIGDRSFYIDNDSPFKSQKGYKDFDGSPLYPKILEGISAVSIHVFGSNTTSTTWNFLAISITGFLALIINRLMYESGRILGGNKIGLVSMSVFMLCPYTYFYVLSGGITLYVLLGTAFAVYYTLKLFSGSLSSINSVGVFSFVDITGLSISLIYLIYLRPSSIIFSLVIVLFVSIFSIVRQTAFSKIDLIRNLAFLCFVFVIGLHQLFQTMDYSTAALNAFSVEPGFFFGYPREALRSELSEMHGSPLWLDKIQYYFYLWLWKVTDFASGMVDVRDTHAAASFPSLFSFLGRTYVGFFFMAPLSLLSLLSVYINRRLIASSGLGLLIIAAFVAVSPSLLGVAMSRYLFMFYVPFLLSAALLIYQLFELSRS